MVFYEIMWVWKKILTLLGELWENGILRMYINVVRALGENGIL